MAIPEAKMRKIERFVKEKLKCADYNHDVGHAKRTVAIARFLAEKEGADMDVCVASALMHDITQPLDRKDHAVSGAEMAGPFLRSLGFDEEFVKKVMHCISCHISSANQKRSIEADVLYDADKLQVTGPFGFCRCLSYLLVFEKRGIREAVREVEDLQKDKYDNGLKTKTAKKLALGSHELMLEFFRLFKIWDESADLEKLLSRDSYK